MRPPLRGILPIDEAVEVFPDLRSMSNDNLDIILLEMDDWIERLFGDVFLQQVCQPSLGEVTLPVVDKCQPCVEEGIVLHHRDHELILILIVTEELCIGTEDDARTGWFV